MSPLEHWRKSRLALHRFGLVSLVDAHRIASFFYTLLYNKYWHETSPVGIMLCFTPIMAMGILESKVTIFEVLLRDWTYEQGQYTEAHALLEEGLALFKEMMSKEGISWSLRFQGRFLFAQGDQAGAAALMEESLRLSREVNYQLGVAYALDLLGRFALAQVDTPKAWSLLQESLALLKRGRRSAAEYSVCPLPPGNHRNDARRQGRSRVVVPFISAKTKPPSIAT